MYKLSISQAQMITFVMINAAGTEVPGLAGTFVLQISKAGGAFVASTGAKAEIGSGWYSYVLSALETNTVGPLSIFVTGAGCIQQNLAYVVKTAIVGAIPYTYMVLRSVVLTPIAGADVWVTTDIAGTNVIWNGDTDALGVARDDDGDLPYLAPGTYYFWKSYPGMSDDDNPDTEVVSSP